MNTEMWPSTPNESIATNTILSNKKCQNKIAYNLRVSLLCATWNGDNLKKDIVEIRCLIPTVSMAINPSFQQNVGKSKWISNSYTSPVDCQRLRP